MVIADGKKWTYYCGLPTDCSGVDPLHLMSAIAPIQRGCAPAAIECR
jgi:hypothetical protein